MSVRVAARVLLLDPSGRVLLFRGSDPHEPGRPFWFTTGGGVEAGESLVTAALRELQEETGIRLGAEELTGPVWRRRTRFRFESTEYEADEWFFVATVAGGAVDTGGFNELEVRTVSGHRWWSVDELRTTPETIFPVDLAEHLADLVDPGWDGSLRTLHA